MLPFSIPVSANGSSDDPGWHLRALDIDVLHNQNVTGAGVRIAVIDTGVRLTCPALEHAAIEAWDGDGGADGTDHHGHGTSMISILVGDQIGICPDAAVVSIRAFSSTGAASASWIAEGIHTALTKGVDIINISGGQDAASNELAAAVKAATDRGVVVVAAADNDHPYSPLYPACIPTVISVTASASDGAIVNAAPPGWIDLAAPGENIETYVFDSPATLSGTSEATAILSGVCALLLGELSSADRRALGPHLLAILKDTATTATNSTGPGDCRIVNPRAALAKIEGRST